MAMAYSKRPTLLAVLGAVVRVVTLLVVTVLVVTVLVVAALPSAGRAQEADATAVLAARALFNEGVALTDGGDWAQGAERFRRALSLRDSPVIAFNLGVALGHLGQPVEASELFRRILRSEALDPTLRASATAELAATEPQIAWLTVTYAARTEGLQLVVDGAERPLALVGTSIPLDPGTHTLTLRRGEHVVGEGAAELAPGAREELALRVIEVPLPEPELPQLEAPAPAPLTILPQEQARGDDPAPWIGLGIAGAVVVAGAIVLAVVLVPPGEPSPYAGSLGTVEIGR